MFGTYVTANIKIIIIIKIHTFNFLQKWWYSVVVPALWKTEYNV